MSHYTSEELIALWKREEVTVEQMIGQLVQAMATLEQRLRALERRVPEPVMEPRKAVEASRKDVKPPRRG